MKRVERKPYNCSRCGETNHEKFYRSNGGKSKCKSCAIKETVIAHRDNPEYQKRQTEYYRQWYGEKGRDRSPNYQGVIVLWQARHPDAVKARNKVAKAIREGLLKRSLRCAMCGKSNRRINGHHENYDIPYAVIWLCSSCHKKIHLRKDT